MTSKVCVVTGGASGIGEAIAWALGRTGASVAIFDVDFERAKKVAAAIVDSGMLGAGYECDVSDRSSVESNFARVASDFGPVDVLVNNAGVSFVGPHIQDTDDNAWNKSIGVMQTGVFYCMRAASSHMLPRKSGCIVNVSSIRGFSPNPGRVAYCAAKAAVLMMTRVAAAEWGPYKVTVNAVAPGVQRTPMWERDVQLGVCDEQRVLSVTPVGRLGKPSEIGDLVCFLASDAAKFITGACITIDGGLTAVPAEGDVVRPG